MLGVRIDTITIADEGSRWADLGFEVSDDSCQLGSVLLRFNRENEGRGIVGWSLSGLTSTALDGLPTSVSTGSRRDVRSPHPNGVITIDHLVGISSNLDRSVSALQGAGLDLRRIREEPTPAGAPRQAFFRLGSEVLEIIQEPVEESQQPGMDRPLRFWGLALVVMDMEDAVRQLGENVGPVKRAVQPGRQIATVRRSAGIAVPLALMSEPAAAQTPV
jgi:hypothetical protein